MTVEAVILMPKVSAIGTKNCPTRVVLGAYAKAIRRKHAPTIYQPK
jgi:hypothetical protein